MLKLLSSLNFGPYFATQFLGAFNDNVYKNALIILITYSLAAHSGLDANVMVNLCAGLFILPYFLFSALAGQLADRKEKSSYIRLIKITELIFMLIGAIAFLTKNIYLLLIILFFMGAQSSFFGPVKYAILPQHLSNKDLVNGNALVEMGTFLAILLGTIVGGILISLNNGVFYVGIAIIFFSILGIIASLKIPKAPAVDKNLKLNLNVFSESLKILKHIYSYSYIFIAIVGISWFWFYGAILLAQFPAYAKHYLFANEQVVTCLLAVFSLGIGLGSIYCGYYSKHNIKRAISLLPIGAIGLTVFGIILSILKPSMAGPELMNISTFIQSPINKTILLTLALLSFSGGLYIVPLYTFIQQFAPENYRSRVIAGNNILNALFMVVASIFAIVILNFGITILQLFQLLAIGNIVIIVSCFVFRTKFIKTTSLEDHTPKTAI